MSRTERLWLRVVPVAVAAGAAAAALTLASDHLDARRFQALLTVLTGGSFVVAGLIARTRRPLNRTGLLLIAVGLTWFVGAGLTAANNSVLFTLGVALTAIPAGFLIHLLLSYPSGRLQSRWDRFIVAAGYVLVVLGQVTTLPVDPDPLRCSECPDNAFLIGSQETATDILTLCVSVVAVLYLLAVVATIVRRWHRSSPAARRTLTPVLLVGGVTLLLFAVSVGTHDVSSTVSEAAGWAAMLVLVELPFLFLWGLLRSRLARADIGRALADAQAGGAPGSVRQLLRDPTAEVLYARAAPEGGYIDVYGRPRDASAEAGRAITHIERKGRPLAAIVHDATLLEEPELLEQVAAAVGLEVERDKNLHALQASERRSRALLEAIPDKMFRVSRDGIILDVQESKAAPGSGVAVGSSLYDGPVPRAYAERVMETGRQALETGELQAIEWEIDKGGDLRYAEGRFMPSGEDEFYVVIRDVTERKRQEVQQAALHRVALAVASEARPEQIFDLVAEEIAKVLGAHTTNLVRIEPGLVEGVTIGGWRKPGHPAFPIGERFPLDGTASEEAMKTGRPVRRELRDQEPDTWVAQEMRSLDIGSLVAAPITLTGRPWGAAVATLTAPHSFPRGAEERLSGFARLVSLALANEEARAELAASRARLVSAGDEERRRLERNLHDGAQQRLVSLSLSLRLAQTKLEKDPDAARELLTAAGNELSIALEELRELARGIHPAVLTERGLGPALQTLADRAPLPVDVQLPPGRLPRRVEAAAYYVVSEALANVAKYARASEATVSVANDNGALVVEVVDDGVGGADPEQGTGLRGLSDRIEALDGTLHISSQPGRGTTIHAEIPFAAGAVPVGS